MKKKTIHSLMIMLSVIALASAIIISCRKLDHETLTRTTSASDFFRTSGAVHPAVLKVIKNLKHQNEKTGFIQKFITDYGLARWDKAIVSTSSAGQTQARDLWPNKVEMVLIPIALENVEQVHAALGCAVFEDSVLAIRLFDGRDYPSYASRTDPGLSAFELSLTLMQLDYYTFGHDVFQFTDSLAAKGKPFGISTVGISSTDSTYFRFIRNQVTTCVIVNVPIHNGQVTGCPAGTPDCPQYTTALDCTTYTLWEDDGSIPSGGGDPGGGGGGGEDGSTNPPPCQPAGGRLIVEGKIAPLCETNTVPGNSPGWEPVIEPPNTPCLQAALANIKISALLRDTTIISNQMAMLTATIATDVNEKNFTFGTDNAGNSAVSAISGGGTTSTPFYVTDPNFTVQGAVHTHPGNAYAMFSAGDMYAIAGANAENPAFKHYLVTSSSATYALSVIDPIKLADFLVAHPKNVNFDTVTHGWNPNEEIGHFFRLAETEFAAQGLSEDEAFESAMAYVIKKFDIGLAVSKKNSNGDFEGLYVDELPPHLATRPLPLRKTTICNL